MTDTVQEIITSFEHLPLDEQNEVTKVILRRSLDTETPSLSDDELLLQAEELFRELDKEEAKNGRA